jgi:hypothetical protein
MPGKYMAAENSQLFFDAFPENIPAARTIKSFVWWIPSRLKKRMKQPKEKDESSRHGIGVHQLPQPRCKNDFLEKLRKCSGNRIGGNEWKTDKTIIMQNRFRCWKDWSLSGKGQACILAVPVPEDFTSGVRSG